MKLLNIFGWMLCSLHVYIMLRIMVMSLLINNSVPAGRYT